MNKKSPQKPKQQYSEDQFEQKLKEKYGQNIIYKNPISYTQMKDFNFRNPSYGVTVEYNFLQKIQDQGLLESSQLQFFMNVFKKAYQDVKLAAASCYFFSDLIVTQEQAIQPQQQPIIFKLDWKRPTVQDTPQEQNKIQEPPKPTIEKDLSSTQNYQLQNKQNSQEIQKLSKNDNNPSEIEQSKQQKKNTSKKDAEIQSPKHQNQQPLNSQETQSKPSGQQHPRSEIIQSKPQQDPKSQEVLSQTQQQDFHHSNRKYKQPDNKQHTQEKAFQSQIQDPHNDQTELVNPPMYQLNNTQEIQIASIKQQSTISEETQSNSQKYSKESQQFVDVQKDFQQQEHHQLNQIKNQHDEINDKSLQSNQSNQKQQVIGQVNQQTQQTGTSNQKPTNHTSQINTSSKDSTQKKPQNDSTAYKSKEQNQNWQVTQDQQHLNQVAANQDNSRVKADQNKQAFQQNQKEVPESQPLNQEPAQKTYHFQFTSQAIEQKPQKEILSMPQLGPLIKQFAENNNLSENQLKNQDYWFFPINQQQTHWVSAVVQFNPKKIYYFDSYYEKIDPLIKKGIHQILEYCNFNSNDFEIIPYYNRQENCYDCGIFLLLSLLYTLRRKEYNYNQILINNWLLLELKQRQKKTLWKNQLAEAQPLTIFIIFQLYLKINPITNEKGSQSQTLTQT
ncbi:unnamed protein product (macronuclear) [Paramecium tetraurelia]|uniref:Chromosome undetermined scaffold_1, whole genome shotgun sequence n=1 Tax=Paramecium tetraurelia TaxID=5888 RepID=Q6BFT1_PARTE|nr:hypothetical protein [Paramecium tetraurelia strain d4-2]XP_001423174.1 uncharacterized protein GSPATT00000211001 [Paramecium tetraurelia]CAH03489.1 hypothetical protein, C48 peptidase motif [Paramecium tetraurelia]CAK55776.1 unnamed protein product [Paramecium tetraurelia]|eukprot:XP_001423174.1 hypothetical protein (macronuclear) [Paramecium tetraurelia strain d4-2]